MTAIPAGTLFRASRLYGLPLAVLGLPGLASAPQGGDCLYQEEGGFLAIEIESAEPTGSWAEESSVPGYTGESYFRWAGPNHFTQPGNGTFGFDFEIHTGGTYWFRIRNHHDHPDQTLENDVWVRLDGGEWVKTFSSTAHQWNWQTRFEFHDGTKPNASYDLAPGEHRIEFSGRSANFRMDRFHIFLNGHPDGLNPDAPESSCDGGGGAENRPPIARMTIDPPAVPAGDDHRTVITLRGGGSSDPDGDELSYEWFVRGGQFVGGTTPTSKVARVTIPGGRAWPVRLTVTDDGEPNLSDRVTGVINVLESAGQVHGEPVAWHPMEVWFRGPTHSEMDVAPNPFLDYRLTVEFVGPQDSRTLVHGFFDGDGQGGGTGDVWKVRFSPDKGGIWEYRASFVSGTNVAIDQNLASGSPTAFHGAQGQVIVLPRDEDAPGFLSKGRLEYVGEHYMKFRDGGYFVKGGTNSPENFFGYAGFDDIEDMGNLGIIHEYGPHRAHWNPGDPEWVSSSTGVDSKGIIGALNYLSDKGVNSIYFLPMNLGGDGRETCPFVAYGNNHFNKTHYDISRMQQWHQTMSHAQRKGILLHFVLAETEIGNETWLDGGTLGTERKLFYRELAARFGHNLAVKWNLCEENDYSVGLLVSFAEAIDFWDASNHPISVHTHPNNFQDYEELKGHPLFKSTSIQYDPNLAASHVESWRQESAAHGQKWVLDMDENNPAGSGLTNTNADDLRKRVLYDVYFSGGQIEWYMGYHPLPLGGDVKVEDFSTREAMWNYMRYARTLLESLPFVEMEPSDDLLTGESSAFGGGQVFAKPGEVYAIYLPSAESTGQIDLGDVQGPIRKRWFNPRTGEFAGNAGVLEGGGLRALGAPPSQPQEDWVVLLTGN